MLVIFLCSLIFLQRTKKMGAFFAKKPQNISAFQLFSLDEFGCNLYQLKIVDFSVKKVEKGYKKSLGKLKKKIHKDQFHFFPPEFFANKQCLC